MIEKFRPQDHWTNHQVHSDLNQPEIALSIHVRAIQECTCQLFRVLIVATNKQRINCAPNCWQHAKKSWTPVRYFYYFGRKTKATIYVVHMSS